MKPVLTIRSAQQPSPRLKRCYAGRAWAVAPVILALACSQTPPPDDETDTSSTSDTSAVTDTTTDTSDDLTDSTDAITTEETTAPVDPTADTTGVEPDPTGVDPDPTGVAPDPTGVDPDPTGVDPDPTGVDPDPTGDPMDYFPLGDGYQWTYDHIDGATQVVDWVEEVKVSATTWNGQAAWRIQDSPDASGVYDVQTWVLIADRVERVHRDEFQGNTLRASVDYTPGFTRFASAWSTEGYTETITYTRDETDSSGAVDSKVRYQKYEVESVGDSVEVQGTTYEDCVVVTRVRVDAQGVVQTDQANNADSNARYWYCRGVGKVQEENLVSGSREELTNYTF